MKHFLPALLLVFSFTSRAQNSHTVQSSCIAHDTVKLMYFTDAERLAVNGVLHNNFLFKDSVQIDTVLRNRYLGALLAVYNATAIPERDTVVKFYSIHRVPNPELHIISVKALASHTWMDSLSNSSLVTNYPPIDYLIAKYNLMVWGYFSASNYDVVLFASLGSINTKALTDKFAAISGVISAEAEAPLTDETNIGDSITSGFILLNYSIGWGTCYDGCDFRHYWHFKVDSNCVVSYEGSSGTPLPTGISKHSTLKPSLRSWPNPFSENLTIECDFSKAEKIELLNVLGEPVLSAHPEPGLKLSTSQLPNGIYFIRVSGDTRQQILKVVKQE